MDVHETMRPFTWKMWVVTGAILLYTMLIFWLLEHKQNPDFNGPWQNQICTALWFTFSSLFFAHRERIYSNLTRVVVVVWLFVVLILISSYAASLSSMLTVKRLKPSVTDIEWLKRNNLKVGCDGDSFVREYLENVLGFKSDNILNVSSEYNYQEEFKNNIIAAAFLEVPYEKVFITRHCEGYTATAPTNRFGGLGFVFQKGSPIAADFSKAILKLSENGVLKSLEEKNYRHDRQDTSQSNIAPSMRSIWSEVVRLVKYICNREGMQNPGRVLTFARPQDVNEWSSSMWENTCPSDITDDLQESSEADVEMRYIPGCS
ncbi:hypothetical protein Q3G72_010032 [Acer saccharum]|nr:hypothetical protein Q3G72_010032 [Acer saccharum]